MKNNNTTHDCLQEQSEINRLLSRQRANELEALFRQSEENDFSSMPKGFFIMNDKLMYLDPQQNQNDQKDNATQPKEPLPVYVGSKISVIAYARDENNENYGKLLRFIDPEGVEHEWIMPMEFLIGDGNKYKTALVNRGYKISMLRSAQNLLSIFLSGSEPKRWIRLVHQLGWHKNRYVLAGEVLGNAEEEELFFQCHQQLTISHTHKGSLQEWISNVAKLCIGNPLLEFAVSCAFAAPLLHLLNIESGGFHLRGSSSKGKSKILEIATSVWGNRDLLQRWNATTNGLEALASSYNDSLLCLDEISQIDPAFVGETAYLLANGKGKLRANKLGLSNGRACWRMLFLSNGEISLAEHAMKSGKEVKAGQELRILDISAVMGNHGCFEELHGCESGEKFADLLSEVSSKYFGTASRTYINYIIHDRAFAVSYAMNIKKQFIEQHRPVNGNSQVMRALNRFAIVAAGGELATEYGLTGWKTGAASDAVSKCFKNWFSTWGGSNDREEIQILSRVCNFFTLHEHDKFKNWNTKIDSEESLTASFRKADRQGKIEFFAHKSLFLEEICKEMNSTNVARVCIKHGLLLPDSEGKFTRSEEVSINKIKDRYYRFTSKVLETNIKGEL